MFGPADDGHWYQPSSMLTYLYPALASPVRTRARASPSTWLLSAPSRRKLQPLQPITGAWSGPPGGYAVAACTTGVLLTPETASNGTIGVVSATATKARVHLFIIPPDLIA